PVENFEEAIRVANGVEVGLSASIVTRNLRKALLYTEQIEAGVVKVNQISTGLALQAPFGGVKKSSTDSFKEQGAGAIEFYTKLKTVCLDYSVYPPTEVTNSGCRIDTATIVCRRRNTRRLDTKQGRDSTVSTLQ